MTELNTNCTEQDSEPPTLRLRAGEVDVWRIEVDRLAGCRQPLWDLLSGEEQDKARRFVFDKDRVLYVAAHAALRWLLSRYLDCSPTGVVLAQGRDGKPFLDGRGLHFNLSHTAGLALCAVCPDRDLGIDVERVRADAQWEEIAERFFSAGERAAIKALPQSERLNGFFRCWTRKEAYLKAQGSGLRVALDSFSVPVEREIGYTSLAPAPPATGSEWTLSSFDMGPDYEAALVARGRPTVVRWSRLKPSWLRKFRN